MNDADILDAAAKIIERDGRYATGTCATCGHPREDHLGTVDGVKIGCVGGWGRCDDGDGPGCMRYTEDWRFDNRHDGATMAERLRSTAAAMRRRPGVKKNG